MIEYLPLIMGVVSFGGAALTWYDAAVRKRYASERAVEHLKKNYESLVHNIAAIDRMLDQRLDAMERDDLERRMLLQLIASKAGVLADQPLLPKSSRGDGDSRER